MANQMTDPPLESDFGYDFNYAVWTEGTRISLVNVPWNNDYRDVVKFSNRAALNAYLTDLENADYVIEDMAYAKAGNPIRIDLPFNKVYRFNYLRASNPAQPIPGSDTARDFYYFITDVRYVAPNTTEIIVQLDVFQTFIYDVTLGNCYIERGHIGIANQDGFDAFGRSYLTIPEGLDIGGEYMNVHHRNINVMRTRRNDSESDQFSVLIVSTVDLTADPGTVEAPILKTAKGGVTQGMPNGADVYLLNGNAHESVPLLFEYLSDKPWISQGIISLNVVPPAGNYGFGGESVSIPGTSIGLTKLNTIGSPTTRYNMVSNWRDHENVLAHMGERYQHLKKLLTYPFTILELTTFEGKPIILKPEAWAEPNAMVVVRLIYAPPHFRMVISPRRYNAKADSDIETWEIPPAYTGPNREVEGDDGGDFLDVFTMISDFPSFSIVNNMGIAYLANNANQLAFMQRAADWAQQRALRGNEVAYDQASGALGAARTLTDLANTADYAQTMLGNANMFGQAGIGALGGITSGLVQGGMGGAPAGPGGVAIGAGMGAVGTTIGSLFGAMGNNLTAENNAKAQSIRAASNMAANNVQNKQGELVRDTNKQLADWAARGDYENTIAGINAKAQDAQLTQPSVSGQVGGNAFNIVNSGAVISLRIKMLDPAALAVVGEYWLRYGYAVRRFGTVPDSLMVMTKFTYWKLLETYIAGGPMPEGFKQAIRGIFEKGVTVWADPQDIGNIDLADNAPLEGISY